MNCKSGLNKTQPNPLADENTTPSDACQVKTLDKDTITEIYNKIEVYPNCIVLKPSDQYKGKFEGKRGKRDTIKTFSKRSRFRLFSLLAKIDNKLFRKPMFLSLTFHYGHEKKDKKDHSVLHNFLVQLRNFDPGVQFIWRKELQKRGAPHYHLIIFPLLSEDDYPDAGYFVAINSIWHQVADPKSEKHSDFGCKSTVINSYREACIYLSKYIAKVEHETVVLEMGRHWGASNNLPIKLITTIPLNEHGYQYTINLIRKWLIKNGKEKQADPEYLNIFSEETIFINEEDFIKIISENPG